MNFRIISRILPAFLLPVFAFSIVSQQTLQAESLGESLRPFFKEHCIRCHGPEKTKGKVRLDKLPSTISDEYSAEAWQEVLDVLNGAEMPPEDEPQPKTGELAEAIATMTDGLFEARRQLVDSGSVTIRRLNKREYAKTIRHLLGVPVNTNDLPSDGTLDGFDTVGDAHFMSVPQFETYLKLGRVALDRALVEGPRPEQRVVRSEPERDRNKKAEATIAAADGKSRKSKEFLVRSKEYLAQPAAKTGFILDLTQKPFGGQAHDKAWVDVPRARKEPEEAKASRLGDPIGRYVARFRVGLTCEPQPGEKLFVDLVRTDAFSMQVQYTFPLGTFEISRTMDDPHVFEVPFENFGETDDKIAVVLSKIRSSGSGAKRPPRGGNKVPDSTKEAYVWVDWVEVEGPFIEEWPPKAWRETFPNGVPSDASKESGYAREIIAGFAKRAFRGQPANDGYLDQLQAIYEDYRRTGSPFVEAIKEPLSVILSSPSFVYLVEPSAPDGKRQLSGLELASRLSYFLWSHPPDGELRMLGESGRLSDPEVLRGQIERMLEDPKAEEFSGAFFSQWLELPWLDMIVVNGAKFPQFNETVRRSFRNEPIEFFRDLIRHDLSVTNLIDSDFVVIDGVLSEFYGIKIPANNGKFQKVVLPPGSPRGGLLGTGAILTMTGTGERTSPVERGVFVYSRMLGRDIPPPPPNVPQLEIEDGSKLTVRETLELHTSKAQCASCHRRMDPLGFGLEHFDAIGSWRDGEVKMASGPRGNRQPAGELLPIDATGAMPDRKRQFDGHEELKAHLMEDRDAMARGFLRSLLTYALGRRVGFADGPFVDELQARWKYAGYGMRTLLHLVVQSEPFQSK